jgi:hypothetical protein
VAVEGIVVNVSQVSTTNSKVRGVTILTAQAVCYVVDEHSLNLSVRAQDEHTGMVSATIVKVRPACIPWKIPSYSSTD